MIMVCTQLPELRLGQHIAITDMDMVVIVATIREIITQIIIIKIIIIIEEVVFLLGEIVFITGEVILLGEIILLTGELCLLVEVSLEEEIILPDEEQCPVAELPCLEAEVGVHLVVDAQDNDFFFKLVWDDVWNIASPLLF
jgi:hypothetical protein